jgi:hypothetical protein
MTPMPIYPTHVTSAITASVEKHHPEAMFHLVMKTLDSPCINPT